MKNKTRKKTVLVILCVVILFGSLGMPSKSNAMWTAAAKMINEWAVTIADNWVFKEISAIVIDAAKKVAMDRFRKRVMKLIAEKGGLVLNYGKYIYGSGDSAASQYWQAFLSNCTNINPNVSLAIKANGVDRLGTYDWCPLKVNSRGVNLGTVDISAENGWEDFSDFMSWRNNPYSQYFQAKEDVAEVRKEGEVTALASAGPGGMKSTTKDDEAGTTTGSTGGPAKPPSESEGQNIDTWSQQYEGMLGAATLGTFNATANVRGMISAVTTLALNYFADEYFADDAWGIM